MKSCSPEITQVRQVTEPVYEEERLAVTGDLVVEMDVCHLDCVHDLGYGPGLERLAGLFGLGSYPHAFTP